MVEILRRNSQSRYYGTGCLPLVLPKRKPDSLLLFVQPMTVNGYINNNRCESGRRLIEIIFQVVGRTTSLLSALDPIMFWILQDHLANRHTSKSSERHSASEEE